MTTRLIAAVLALFCAVSADALSIRFEFEGAVQSSAAIAWIEIKSAAEIVAPSGQNCGTRYRAMVVDGIKGMSTGEQIEFGYFSGKTVGSQHFVFLADKASWDRKVETAARIPMTSPIPFIAECREALPHYVETAEGTGTMHVMPGEHISNVPSVSFGDPLYAIPRNLPGPYWHIGHIIDSQLFGSVQIAASDFSKYLRTLATRT